MVMWPGRRRLAKKYVAGIAGQTNDSALGHRARWRCWTMTLQPASPLQMAFDSGDHPWMGAHLGLVLLSRGRRTLRTMCSKGERWRPMGIRAWVTWGWRISTWHAALAADPTRFSVTDIHFAADNLAVRHKSMCGM